MAGSALPPSLVCLTFQSGINQYDCDTFLRPALRTRRSGRGAELADGVALDPARRAKPPAWLAAASVLAGILGAAAFAKSAWGARIPAPAIDMLDIVGAWFRASDQGRVLAFLLEPHNYHRLVWFRGLVAADVGLFGGISLPFVVVAVLCLAAATAMLVAAVRRAAGPLAWPLMAIAVMLAASAASGSVIGVPVNTPHVHTLFFAVLALFVAEPWSGAPAAWRHWVAAMACAAAASFSLALGLAVWPVLAAVAWLARAPLAQVGAILAVGATFTALYLTGQAASAADDIAQAGSITGLADFLLAYLGLPWTRASGLGGRLIGAVLLGAGAWALVQALRRPPDRTRRFALGLILFALAGAVLATLGRGGVVEAGNMPVRYAIVVAPLHVGLLILAVPGLERLWAARPRAVEAGLAAGLALLLVQQVTIGHRVEAAGARARQTLVLYQQGVRTPDMLEFVFPDFARADAHHAEMRRRGVYQKWVGPGGPVSSVRPAARPPGLAGRQRRGPARVRRRPMGGARAPGNSPVGTEFAEPRSPH